MKPILFSGPMVKSILAGNKTQTRRIVKPQPDSRGSRTSCVEFEDYHGNTLKPRYQVGDILWVRETWRKATGMPTGWRYEYRATAIEDGAPLDEPWKPSIFMPRDACRIFLKVTSVRIERLEDITVEDAISEGVESWVEDWCSTRRYKCYFNGGGFWDDGSHTSIGAVHPAIASYRSLWLHINGQESLNSNPWVWVYEFEICDK